MASRWPQLTRGQFKVWLCRPCVVCTGVATSRSFPVYVPAAETDQFEDPDLNIRGDHSKFSKRELLKMIPGEFLWDNIMVTLDQVQSWWVPMSAFEWRWEAGTEARPWAVYFAV